MHRRIRIVAGLLIGVLIALCAIAIYIPLDRVTDKNAELTERSAASAADRADLRAENSEQDAKIALLVGQLEALGQEPVVTPSSSAPSTSGGPSVGLIQSLIDLGLTARCGGPVCKGDPGLPAPPAKDGTDGGDGVDGQTPSTELLLSLIQPLIPAPVPGADGVGIVSIACTSPAPFPLSFDVAFTDGTTQTVTCPSVIEPEPETPEVQP